MTQPTQNFDQQKSRIPLVLLPGWGVNSRVWEPVVEALHGDFEVSLIDLPGYGTDVDYRGDYSMNSVVARMMSSAPAKAIWVGWSLGATIAMHAALQFPDRFFKLQLIAATPRFMVGEDWKCGMKPEPMQQLESTFLINYEQALKRFLLLQTDDRSLARELCGSILGMKNPSHETLQQSLRLLAETDLRQEIGRLSVETRIIAGEEDRLVPKEASQRLADSIARAECLLVSKRNSGDNLSPSTTKDTTTRGHLCFLEDRHGFINNLKQFAGVVTP